MKLRPHSLFQIVSLLCAAWCTESVIAAKPNVLFIALDDLKPILGCYGDSLVKTPQIDRLAARSTVFLKNYCQQAICGPTRASLMSGRRPDYTQIWDLKTRMRDVHPEILTLPQYFRQQGYITSGIGKIYDPRCIDNNQDQDKPSWSIPYHKVPNRAYLQGKPPLLGYYQSPATLAAAKQYEAEIKVKGLTGKAADDYLSEKIKPSVESADVTDNAYKDGAMTDHAQVILAELAKAGKPFFFGVGFARPHLPFVAPKKYWDLYRREEMPLAKFQKHAAESPELAYHNSGELRSYTDIPSLATFDHPKDNRIGLPPEKQRELLHGYYAAVSYVDSQVGELLDTLDRLDLTKDTIIVLWGDHGWHLGDHDLWCKHSNFEQAVRAPLLISAPGIAPNKTESVTEFVDLFPTLCELSSLPIPQELDGKSLVSVMRAPLSQIKDFAVSQYPRDGKMGYSIRTSGYRLTWWLKNNYRSNQPYDPALVEARELYDYAKDPLEEVNVISADGYQTIAAALSEKMVSYLRSQQSR